MAKVPNIFQMYIENDCKFGFFVTRNSWSNNKFAMVVSIDGVEEGKMIEGEPPYFTRKYPEEHRKAGKVWPRIVYLKATWFDRGKYETDCGGTYAWTRIYPNQ
jgi:hypothetical protein